MITVESLGSCSLDGTLLGASDSFIPKFDRLLRRYVYFSLFFLVAILLETAFIIIFFPFLIKSSLLAFGLALLFFTVFSFWIFRMFHQTSKEMNFIEIKDKAVDHYKKATQFQEGVPQDHLALATFCQKLSESLSSKELNLYIPPKFLSALRPLLTQFSCWWHWEEVYQMRELLLKESVKEHVKVIKCAPTSFEVHTALANAYILLATLYASPRQTLARYRFGKIFSEFSLDKFDRKFQETSKKAIEEFKILKEFSPNDPWIHLQLAYSYHDLKMVHEEIAEYEIVLKITPDDSDLLFRLGSLYFRLGENGKGLKVYDNLKRLNPKKAEGLIALYGCDFSVSDFLG